MCQSCGIIHGYGSYEEVLDKSWSAKRLSLLDRNWVVAFADVRGDGGADLSWHKSGSGLKKLNTINDFISCGNYLISEGYVHQDQLSAIGHTTVVAAAIKMHSELFRADDLKVLFLDIYNTLLDPNLPLTVLDYEEFGNPQIKTDFDSIMKYSPYDNIRKHICYPAMLVTSSYYDSRTSGNKCLSFSMSKCYDATANASIDGPKERVTSASWRKFPDPENKHTLSHTLKADNLNHKLNPEEGKLYTTRAITIHAPVPWFLRKIVGQDICHYVESTIVDAKTRSMQLATRTSVYRNTWTRLGTLDTTFQSNTNWTRVVDSCQ
ncbi:protease 2-like protein isoform X1, partial [Tanacetum coccineum]